MQVALQNYNVTYDKRVWDRTQIKVSTDSFAEQLFPQEVPTDCLAETVLWTVLEMFEIRLFLVKPF